MSIIRPTPTEVEYPSSDGQPMAETPLHRRWFIYIDELLVRRYRGRRAYVGLDMLMYYVPGDPTSFVVPGNFVAFDCEPGELDVYKTWEMPPPGVVIEVTSKGPRAKVQVFKPEILTAIGVREIFFFDPRGERQPALQGMRVVDDVLTRIEPDSTGAIESDELGITLRLVGGNLVIADRATGEVLQTDLEALRAESAASAAPPADNAERANVLK